MFNPIFCKSITKSVFHLKVCGVSSCNSMVVWGAPIEYMLAKYFVDNLNEHKLPEEELFDATHAFLTELNKLERIDLWKTEPRRLRI